MISFKNKIEILKTLKTKQLDLSELTKYLDLLQHKSLTAPILDKIIETLIEMDAQITAVYESVSDDEWNDIASDYDTPLEKQSFVLVRDNIKTFVTAYKAIEEIMREVDLNILFTVFNKIPVCRTSSIQFLFFSIAIYKPNPVLYYLFDNLKDKPTVFIPYFASFVSRCNIDCTAAILKYLDWVRRLRRGKHITFILATQGLMYICCFKPDLQPMCKDIIDYAFINDIYIYMNSLVVEKFCSMFSYEFKVFKSLENSSLYSFPFDKSILESIHELYEDHYIEFQ